ncbi:unnamed protein product [Prorocentrum cordatum]|uniref:Subtilisin n=1 Tax=Prorocentrum cordatum TaxID=2364126 RepID=A0ABN9S901_9DINO|nr:unnamed protein product [Polarella glacialis]
MTTTRLVASDGAAGDYFGISVAVSSDGARVVVGASSDDGGSGSAYVLDGATGERLLKLVASDGAGYEKFGNSVAVSSDGARVVVGAYYDDDQGTQSGSAYVFDGTIVTTETATSSATSSTTTTIKTTTETTSETTTATTAKAGHDDHRYGHEFGHIKQHSHHRAMGINCSLRWCLVLGLRRRAGLPGEARMSWPWQGPNTRARHSQRGG